MCPTANATIETAYQYMYTDSTLESIQLLSFLIINYAKKGKYNYTKGAVMNSNKIQAALNYTRVLNCTVLYCTVLYLCLEYTVVPPFNGPSDERTPAMSGHYLDVRTVLPC